MVKKVKTDKAYQKIKEMVLDEVKSGKMKGEINIEGFIVFETGDLFASLHGLKTLSFEAQKVSDDEFDIEMILFDLYDFEDKSFIEAYTNHGVYEFMSIGEEILFTALNNLADKGEFYDAVQNFEILITINETLTIK